MNRKRRETIENNEISEVCEVNLGGHMQKIMFDGKRKSNPVVIILHGGPGSPIPFCVGCRGLFPDLTEKVTLVCWDQLGCGINNRVIDDSFRIADFVSMTVDLVRYVRERFADSKLYLLGMSWGSLLAAETASAVQDMLDGVVCYGQVLCDMTYNDIVFTALEKSDMPLSKKSKLSDIKKDVNSDNARLIMKWINKYTDGYMSKRKTSSDKNMPVFSIVNGLMTSPDYKFRDFRAVLINGYMKNHSLIDEFLHVDVRGKLSSLAIPYTIIQGSNDIVTPTEIVKDFVSGCENSKIRLRIIENNGHIPLMDATNAIIDEITAMNESVG